jgi:hypothetical protein
LRHREDGNGTLDDGTDSEGDGGDPHVPPRIWPRLRCRPPAVLPSISDRLMMNSTLGPGTMIKANEISANASR